MYANLYVGGMYFACARSWCRLHLGLLFRQEEESVIEEEIEEEATLKKTM